MTERSHLINGRFLHSMDNWTASNASYSAGDGDDHYGVAVLAAGGYIEQDFAVTLVRSYTLHQAVKPVGGTLSANQVMATLTDGDGNTVANLSLEGATANTWQENEDALGLAPGTTYTLRISNASALAVRLDDVWVWAVRMTRAQIAAQVHARLGQLATDYNLSTAASGSLTEGDYTYAIDAGLRSVGALNEETGLPDVRYLDDGMVLTCLDAVETEMLRRVHRSALVEVDTALGPRRESLSQKATAIGAALGQGAGGAASGGRVVVRPLRRQADDYELV